MKIFSKKRNKVERYATVMTRIEERLNHRLRRWSEVLQQRTDGLSYLVKLWGLIVFLAGTGVLCGLLIFYALK